MTNENKLRQIAPDSNPFKVPEGYFQTFPERMMERIAMEEGRSRTTQKKKHTSHVGRWIVAAAMTAVAMGAGITLYSTNLDRQLAREEEQYIEDELDYAMVNNDDIENYLTEAY